MINKIKCFLGFHLGKWSEEGLTCVRCGKFKCKAEVLADLHAGSGW